MLIKEVRTGDRHKVEIIPVIPEDYKSITKSRFWFDWKEEREYYVYKLRIKGTDEILGLISLESHLKESRIEIRLLAVSEENWGQNKRYEHIAGNLIAFACIRSIELFGRWACVSLVPKTKLIQHYMEKYHMLIAGRHLFLDIERIKSLIKRYHHD